MSSNRRLRVARRLPRFQFTLWNLLVFTTGFSVVLGLMKWHLDLGVVAAILMVGTWWTAVAVSAYCGRTAYFLAAATAGVLWYAVLWLPVSPVGFLLDGCSIPALVGCCCVASAGSAAIMRSWITTDDSGFPLYEGFALIYVTAVLFFCVFSAGGRLGIPGFEPLISSFRSITGFFWSTFGVLILVTLSMHVAAPIGFTVIELLQNVEQMAFDLGRFEEDALEAVGVLQVFEHTPILCQDVAKRVGRDPETTKGFLERLRRSGRLQWSSEQGYHRRRPVPEPFRPV